MFITFLPRFASLPMVSQTSRLSAFRAITLLALVTYLGCNRPAVSEPAPVDAMLATQPSLQGVDTNLTRIFIDKSDYVLKLYQQNRLLRTYPVVLGPDPVTDKMREGDGCTPEGKFKVRTKYDHAKWSKFIWVDYPTADSWSKFNARKAAGMISNDATIGGEIGIHGVPEGRDSLVTQHINWTLGCISLKRADVEELFSCIRTGTEIEIQP